MDTKEEILKEIENHKNELVLNFFEVVKLIGFCEGEEDYYYEVLSLKTGKTYLSCVGKLIWLKNVISNEDYNMLEHIFKLNEGIKIG